MPTLADIANFVDSTKRRLSLLAKDPVVFWEMLNSEARDANRAAVDRGNALASAMPQVRDQAIQQMMADPAATATNWMGGGLMNHIVYHGSPHKFDKFDASKIGTGEGAQAYGHGVYLAEKPGVATSYKTAGVDKFGMLDDPMRVAEAFYQASEPLSNGSVLHKGRMFTKDEFISKIRNGSIGWDQFGPATRTKVEKMLMPEGNLYTVDLPDEWLPKMLDWDKPLSQQPEAVRKLRNYAAADDQSITGGEFYRRLIQELGAGQEEVAASLAADGFPGIKYLDGNSRVTSFGPRDSGTSNFVVFPGMEQFLKILKME